jgi:hypothetical protein
MEIQALAEKSDSPQFEMITVHSEKLGKLSDEFESETSMGKLFDWTRSVAGTESEPTQSVLGAQQVGSVGNRVGLLAESKRNSCSRQVPKQSVIETLGRRTPSLAEKYRSMMVPGGNLAF